MDNNNALNVSSTNQKTICIVQLTRSGDVVQTLRSIAPTKEQYPDYKYVLVARKKFAEPLDFILSQFFSEIHYLDFGEIKSNDINSSLEKMNKFVKKISQTRIDLLINLSFSKSSSYLCKLIDAKYKMGLQRDQGNNVFIPDKWSQYVYSTVMNGPQNPFSLEDIYKSIIGVQGNYKLPVSLNKKNYIVIHPFASNERKRWSPGKWSSVVNHLASKHSLHHIIIVGSENDTKDQSIIAEAVDKSFLARIHFQAGKLKLKEIHDLLRISQLFIGHDSLIGHISSLTDVDSITISLGSVRPIESSPYSDKNVTIAPRTSCFPCNPGDKCSFFQCHGDIHPSIVNEISDQIMNLGNVDKELVYKNVSSIHLQNTDIFKSHYSTAGLLEHQIITDNQLNFNQSYNVFYRIVWLYFLEEKEEATRFPSIPAGIINKISQSLSGIQYIYELAVFGKKYTKYLLDEASSQVPDINKIKNYSDKINEIDTLLDKVKDSYPVLSPIVNYFNVAKSNLAGENIIQLAQSCLLVYEEQTIFCGTIYELANRTVQNGKGNPKILSNA